jgi:hypothetical protein
LFGDNASADSWGQPRQDNPLAGEGSWRVATTEQELLDFVKANTVPEFEVLDCPYVLFTLTEKADGSQNGFTAHLLNYQKETLENVRVRVAGGGKVRLLALTPGCEEIREGDAPNEWIIPKLGVYSLLVVEL